MKSAVGFLIIWVAVPLFVLGAISQCSGGMHILEPACSTRWGNC